MAKTVSKPYLKRLLRQSLKAQGYQLNRAAISLKDYGKDSLRQAHTLAVQADIHRAKSALQSGEEQLLSFIANGSDIHVDSIRPVLFPVTKDNVYSRLFRYASLHWSIPISNGYGRRLRFLIFDESNNKLMGLLGLSDPVFSVRARDEWIGWTFGDRRERLYHVMEAYVLGAVPPYSQLLLGKFLAMLATSREVREAFVAKYEGKVSVIRQREYPPDLALVTTTSALGRSSIYNRLKYKQQPIMQSVGYTTGWGTFHFSNGIYEKILNYAYANVKGTAKAKNWGGGEFRNRQEVVRKTIKLLGYPEEWMMHQVQREIFVAPLASNAREYLCGQSNQLSFVDHTMNDFFEFFKLRWLLPRAERMPEYQNFQRESWRLWEKQ